MMPETEPRPAAANLSPDDSPVTTASTTVDAAPAPAPASPPEADVPEPPASRPSWGGLALSTALAVVGGGVGAWIFQHYLDQPEPAARAAAAKPRPEPEPSPTPIEREAPTAEADQAQALDAQFKSLEKRLNRLQEQVAAIPKDQPLPELGALKARVAHIEKHVGAADAADESVKILKAHVSQLDRDLGRLQDRVTVINPVPSADGKPPTARAATSPEPVVADRGDEAMGQGAELLGQGKYAEALQVFENLQRTHPDDARVWYFSALASGYVSRDWKGEAARLVEKGIERERAGTPQASEIDDAMSDLDAKARNWLDYYRRQAHQQARK